MKFFEKSAQQLYCAKFVYKFLFFSLLSAQFNGFSCKNNYIFKCYVTLAEI